ncbi:MAG: hypothetical protein QW222_07200 [Candidatus Bathyarchaeia archaeon]
MLGLICTPAKILVITQAETPETDLLWIGLIYALIIGLWSLPYITLGILESTTSRKTVLLRLIPLLLITNIFLAALLSSQIGYWRGIETQILANYSPFLVPCLLVDVIWLLYMAWNDKFTKALKNMKVRLLTATLLALFPIILAGHVLYSWWQTTML